MTEEKKPIIYKVEDIFHDIENDPDNVNMTIPPEIMESQGWKEGDTLRIQYGDQGTIIIEKVEDDDKKE